MERHFISYHGIYTTSKQSSASVGALNHTKVIIANTLKRAVFLRFSKNEKNGLKAFQNTGSDTWRVILG